ncbi:phage holin family protein [Exiguobacterium sp. SH5S4]|uniref:phage holin family protein n=1 Tax=Exiguobacterium sp. SH5S4 TaxID=2510961 RepID=UPI001375C50D|nr:phage holin family protein [Exiguobacterium sp. SH5S4]
MIKEANLFLKESTEYMLKAWLAINPYLLITWGFVSYILFPVDSYQTYAMIVLGVLTTDLLTKYYAISKTNGGLLNSIRIGKLTSQAMWIGTRKKLLSYLVIMVFVGLAYRFEQLSALALMIGNISYAIMFLREMQSIFENMVQAGHKDLSIWLVWTKRNRESLEKLAESAEEEDSQGNRLEQEKIN